LAGTAGSFAICPITEGSLVRFLMRSGQDGVTAQTVVAALATHAISRRGRLIKGSAR